MGHGEVWWNELRATDTKGVTDFYTRLFRWGIYHVNGGDSAKPANDNEPSYTVWMSGWAQVGGMLPAAPGEKAGWIPFFSVDDVDASAAKAVELGGKIVEPPFDIANSGRFAVLEDPQGAVFGIAKPLHDE